MQLFLFHSVNYVNEKTKKNAKLKMPQLILFYCDIYQFTNIILSKQFIAFLC